ncbi:hypothetical protein [Ktedonobacter robiniae]|uniref:Uncharacterized protein n=1 Tax=Ktedonobacter robiniae TaxID=2778365 RepID=A0ABQ3UP60_9CHLR|nr:hypothetical protein [Ktedonobacter robiniae]GHO54485.1 hypothetical protein KSB_29600 [Ktedonobacter robiniae]
MPERTWPDVAGQPLAPIKAGFSKIAQGLLILPGCYSGSRSEPAGRVYGGGLAEPARLHTPFPLSATGAKVL